MYNVYAKVETNLPDELYVGDGLAFYCSGWLFNDSLEVRKIEVRIGNYSCLIENINEARNEVFKQLLANGFINGRMKDAACSGFFGIIDLTFDLEGMTEKVRFVATFENGQEYVICEKDVYFLKREEYFSHISIPFKPRSDKPLVAICMATYSPQKEPFKRQIVSIQNQSYENWICIINDDGSDEICVSEMKEILSNDKRFYFFRNSKNLGYYNNFERVLRYVPIEAELVALSDQDDYWYPHKLERLVTEINRDKRFSLIYSDMKIVTEKREVIFETYWQKRKNYYKDLLLVLVANTVTGAASIFRQELIQRALPFPQNLGNPFHDHVLACSALASGEIAYVDEPLYDYIQYDDNVIGHCNFDNKDKGLFATVIGVFRNRSRLEEDIYSCIAIYDYDYVRLGLLSRTLLLRGGKPVKSLKIFNNRISSVINLLWLHLKVVMLRHTTNHAELHLAISYLAKSLYNKLYLRVNTGRNRLQRKLLKPLGIKSCFLRYDGCVDVISEWEIYGWASNRDNPQQRVSVDFFINDKLVTTSEASLFREDLKVAGISDGYAGFRFRPDGCLNMDKDNVRIVYSGTQIHLPNGRIRRANKMKLLINRFLTRIVRNQFLRNLLVPVVAQLDEYRSDPDPVYLCNFMQKKIAPLKIDYHSNVKKVNIIIPEINFRNFYGGYIGKFNLMKKLVKVGYKGRVIIVDSCDIDYQAWQKLIFDKYEGLENILSKLEIEYCFDRDKTIRMSPDDTIIATTWWTAHIANKAIEGLNKKKFLYLIQEYEPFTFEMGTYHAMAHQSYTFPHVALFSSKFLQDYFRINKIGLYESGDVKESESMYFENAICKFNVNKERARNSKGKKLLFYARPEKHASRNMFELGYTALCESIEEGCFDDEWSFHGIGSNYTSDIPLPFGKAIRMIGKFDLETYKKIMLDYDVGLAMMYTPHPSLLPLEMAAAGQVVVTNSCMNKTKAQIEALSQNIICCEATIEGVTRLLSQAVKMSGDIDSRIAGTNVKWAFSWDDAFNEKIMENLKGFVDG